VEYSALFFKFINFATPNRFEGRPCVLLEILLLSIQLKKNMRFRKPWNPVPKKKHVPKAPSLIVKDDTPYSKPWKPVNITANNTVATEPYNAPILSPWINEW
jgi:hypothetical protein